MYINILYYMILFLKKIFIYDIFLTYVNIFKTYVNIFKTYVNIFNTYVNILIYVLNVRIYTYFNNYFKMIV